MFFMHRMVELLREEVFPAVEQVTQLFLQNTNKQKIIEYLRLIGQIINRMPKQVESFLSKIISPLISVVLPFFNSLVDSNGSSPQKQLVSVQSEEKRELSDFKKCFFVFLEIVVKNNLSSVLLSSKIFFFFLIPIFFNIFKLVFSS